MTTTDNPPAVSEAAKARAVELLHGELGAIGDFEMLALQGSGYQRAFARFIQQVSDAAKSVCQIAGGLAVTGAVISDELAPFILADPVDPLLIEAREIVARADHDPWPDSPWHMEQAHSIRSGCGDQNLTVRAALNGLRRGMELAREQAA